MKKYIEKEYDDPKYGHVLTFELHDIDYDFDYEVSMIIDATKPTAVKSKLRKQYKKIAIEALNDSYNEVTGKK